MSGPGSAGEGGTLVVGGAGFVGLNIAEALLARGRPVTLFDRIAPPPAAREAFGRLPGRLDILVGDVTDAGAVRDAIRPGLDAIVLGAAITADAGRDTRDPAAILEVNLLSQIPILERAREARVRRVLNLGSAAAYGRAATRATLLDETCPADPESLYAITKFASERVLERLGRLWDLDVVSVRLSAVFGPWERATGTRDTLSPPLQVMTLAAAGRPALLPRPGLRDWLYGPDAAEAVVALLAAERLRHPVYNVSVPDSWPLLEWGRRMMPVFPGLECRLAEPGETVTVSLHAPADRPPLDTRRLRGEIGWTARFGLAESAEHYGAWWRDHRSQVGEVA